jgi:hypothetical protein
MCIYIGLTEVREVCVQGVLAKRTGSMGKAGAGAPKSTGPLFGLRAPSVEITGLLRRRRFP